MGAGREGRRDFEMETSCAEKLARGVCVTHVAAEAEAPQKATISVSGDRCCCVGVCRCDVGGLLDGVRAVLVCVGVLVVRW